MQVIILPIFVASSASSCAVFRGVVQITRSASIGGTRRNAASLNVKISAYIFCIVSGDSASNSQRVMRLFAD